MILQLIIAPALFIAGALSAYLYCHRALVRRRQNERHREMQLLERLAAGLAHEVKNHLGALNLNVQLLEEDLSATGALSDPSRRRLKTIVAEYRRLEDVLNAFLRYASRRELSLIDVNLNSVIEEILTFLKPQIQRAGVSLTLSLSRQAPLCRADTGLIKQALLNVILNSLEAISGSGTLEIATSLESGHALITVSDSGAGVAAQDLPRVFDAYFSTKRDGTGLGLAITRRIVEDHDGSIGIASTEGRGACVTIRLPLSGPRSS